jgi:hypothetical protein
MTDFFGCKFATFYLFHLAAAGPGQFRPPARNRADRLMQWQPDGLGGSPGQWLGLGL